jgi:alpha,alpha-trehalose phosphorylase (configuration-retaining)
MHDTDYSVDFCVHKVKVNPDGSDRESVLTQHIVATIKQCGDEHTAKFIGAGIGKPLFDLAPQLCSTLWKELDIVCMVFSVYVQEHGIRTPVLPTADEQADSVVRKLIMHFGPRHSIRVQIGFRNIVEVDDDGLVRLVESLDDFKRTVREPTWRALLKYAEEIKKMGTKIAFFSSTPQGGGVALMRHALIRLFKLLGCNVKWFNRILNTSLTVGMYQNPIPRFSELQRIIIIFCKAFSWFTKLIDRRCR